MTDQVRAAGPGHPQPARTAPAGYRL